jgi:hypothetical protein
MLTFVETATALRRLSQEELSEFAEIDKTLRRRTLTVLDAAMALARRKVLYEKAFPETKDASPDSVQGDSQRTVWVYFIQIGKRGPIKIGSAINPHARIEDFQVACPWRLRLMGRLRGGEREEKRLHRKFCGHRIRGEWFRPVPEIIGYIRAHTRKAMEC